MVGPRSGKSKLGEKLRQPSHSLLVHEPSCTPTTTTTKFSLSIPKEVSRLGKNGGTNSRPELVARIGSPASQKDLYTNEKPYTEKKRARVCGLVRNVIRIDISSGPGKPAKKGIRIALPSGPNSRDSSPKSSLPKSEASTPRSAATGTRPLTARKQLHDKPKCQQSGKLTIKNITVRRTPSLVADLERSGAFGARRPSKEESTEKDKKSPRTKEIGKVTLVGTGSTSEYSTGTGSFVKFNDAIGQEREKLVQYNKLCISPLKL